jgi:tellurite resistance protein TerC
MFAENYLPCLAQWGGDLTYVAYGLFVLLVLGFLVLDLGVLHRKAHAVSMNEALMWTGIWLSAGLLFAVLVYFAYEGHWLGLGAETRVFNPALASDPSRPLIMYGDVGGAQAAVQYLTGYVVEKSLAMDNIFVIAMVFSAFGIPPVYQHRVLFWGIVGALVLRGLMIGLGGELIMAHQWVLIIFGAFLVATAVKLAVVKGHSDPSRNPLVKLVARIYPVVPFFDGQRFFTRRTVAPTYTTNPATGEQEPDSPPPGTLSARRAITPLLLALIMVEVTDIIFAVDSIPAIFAITPDPFIVFTSNIFAILGLRALYFCLANLIVRFRFLKPALVVILAFVGVKLLLLSVPPYMDELGFASQASIKIRPAVSLAVVLSVLAAAVAASIVWPSRAERKPGA